MKRWFLRIGLLLFFCLRAGAQEYSPQELPQGTDELRERFSRSGQSIMSGLDSLIDSLNQQEQTANRLNETLQEREALAERLRQSLSESLKRQEATLETLRQSETSLARTKRMFRVSLICIPAALVLGFLAGTALSK